MVIVKKREVILKSKGKLRGLILKRRRRKYSQLKCLSVDILESISVKIVLSLIPNSFLDNSSKILNYEWLFLLLSQ